MKFENPFDRASLAKRLRLQVDGMDGLSMEQVGKLNTRLQWCDEVGIPYAKVPGVSENRGQARKDMDYNVRIEKARAMAEQLLDQGDTLRPDFQELVDRETRHTPYDMGGFIVRVFDGEEEISDAEFELIEPPLI